jgi:hypothetical protein
MVTRIGAPLPIVWVQKMGTQWESTDTPSSLIVYVDFVVFAPGDVGLVNGTTAVTLGILDTIGTIQASIAAAIRTYCTNVLGISVAVGSVFMPTFVAL